MKPRKSRASLATGFGSSPVARFKSHEVPWAEYLRTAEMAEETRKQHFRHLSGLWSLLGSNLDPCSPLAIQTYLLKLRPVAKSRAFAVFGRFFRFAAMQGWVSHDPTLTLTRPPNPQAETQGLSAVELDAFLKALDGSCRTSRISIAFAGQRLQLMVRLTMSYGIRTGQHQDTNLADYDVEGNSLLVPPKTSRHRAVRIILSPEFAPLFASYLAARAVLVKSTARLWITYFGGPLTKAAIGRQLEETCRQADLPTFSGLTVLRCTVSRILVEQGCSLFEVQRYLGHRHVTTTDSYLRVHFAQAHFDAAEQVRSKLARLSSITGPEAAGRASEAAGAGTDKPPAPALPLKKGNLP